MPPSASSNRPSRRSAAPVKAPFSCPKSSDSSSVSGRAAQFTAMNGLPRRGERSWRPLATSSLPVPDSPWISTVRRHRRHLLDLDQHLLDGAALADDPGPLLEPPALDQPAGASPRRRPAGTGLVIDLGGAQPRDPLGPLRVGRLEQREGGDLELPGHRRPASSAGDSCTAPVRITRSGCFPADRGAGVVHRRDHRGGEAGRLERGVERHRRFEIVQGEEDVQPWGVAPVAACRTPRSRSTACSTRLEHAPARRVTPPGLPGRLTIRVRCPGAGQPARERRPGKRGPGAHPDRLGDARRLPLEHRPGGLGGHVARGQPGAAGGDDQIGHVPVGPAGAGAATIGPLSSGTSARAGTAKPRAAAQAAMASPEVSARSPREPASEIVRMATRSATATSLTDCPGSRTVGLTTSAGIRSPRHSTSNRGPDLGRGHRQVGGADRDAERRALTAAAHDVHLACPRNTPGSRAAGCPGPGSLKPTSRRVTPRPFCARSASLPDEGRALVELDDPAEPGLERGDGVVDLVAVERRSPSRAGASRGPRGRSAAPPGPVDGAPRALGVAQPAVELEAVFAGVAGAGDEAVDPADLAGA